MQPRTSELLAYLDASDKELDAAVAATPADARAKRAEPDTWSVAEIVEHLGIVHRTAGALLESTIASAREAGLRSETDHDPVVHQSEVQRMANRGFKITSPERARPTGAVDCDTAHAQLVEARARVRELLLAADGTALGEVVALHPALGPIDAYRWFVFFGAHQKRHAAQVREVAERLAAEH
jgi:hypothetical protein